MSDKEMIEYEGPKDIVVHDDSEYSLLLDTAKFNHMWRVAKMFSESKMVPDVFRHDVPSTAVALQMAFRLHVDPMMFLQKSYVVGGRPGVEATVLIALVNQRGPFAGPIDWRFEGDRMTDKWTCIAFATYRDTGKTVEMPIDWATVKAEGWLGKNGSKWKTIPEQMFRYRTAAWLARAYCPEVILGLHSIDELVDKNGSEPIDVTPIEATKAKAIALKEKLAAELEPSPTPHITPHAPGQAPESDDSAVPPPAEAPEHQPQPKAKKSKTSTLVDIQAAYMALFPNADEDAPNREAEQRYGHGLAGLTASEADEMLADLRSRIK